jgi:RNA polymerase sigma-70 factor (ECF subfamily)
MRTFTTIEEKELLERLLLSEEVAFRQIFDAYYPYLTATAYRYLHEREKAKDMAQDAFVALWDGRTSIEINTSLKSYLRQIVVNKCLNYLKREKRIDFSEPALLPDTAFEPEAYRQLEEAALTHKIQTVVDQLPERCRIIFCMSRFDEKSHKEIAEALGISTKTIENQITRALKALRMAMQKSGILLLWIISLL